MIGVTSDFAACFVALIIRSKVGLTTSIGVFASKQMVRNMSRGELAHNRAKHQNQNYQKEAKVGSGSRSLSHLARRLSES